MIDEVWSTENAHLFVQKYMRVCNVLGESDGSKQDLLELAHRYAEEQQTSSQEQYALEFAKELKIVMIKRFGQQAVDHLAEQANQPIPTAKAVRETATAVQAKPSKTVEEWQAEGVRFRPAVARVALPKDEPQDNTPRARHLEHAQALHEAVVATGEGEHAPWGQSAAAMAEWAWQVATGRKISVGQRTALADVLTVLYHAGIMPEGSIIPVGFWHKGHVRGAKRGK